MIFQPHQKLLFIGDSITDCGRRQEPHAPYGSGYVHLARAFLLARYPELQLEIVNRGISGNTVRDLAARWEQDVIAERPDWLSVKIGINDAWRTVAGRLDEAVPLDEYERTYRRLLAGEFQLAPSFSGNTQKYPTRVALNSIYRTKNNPVWGDNVPRAYVEAITEANSTIDPAKQKAAFAKLNQAIVDEAWVISIAYRQTVFGLAKYVKGFDFTVDDMVVAENIWLDK